MECYADELSVSKSFGFLHLLPSVGVHVRDETAVVVSLQSRNKIGLTIYCCSGSNAAHPEISPSRHRHCSIATTQYGAYKNLRDSLCENPILRSFLFSEKTAMDPGLPDSNSA
ncbi:hypothetical protein OIU79_006596 [Salix purpurea]|uniref:Uncharacterized protein n=1 Tax=Salix purpurea TaxID=77065 RepID=A0A9Q0TVW1_SALPP|nr:hypothetical protein OIU79_006596 [Salix purpurea]